MKRPYLVFIFCLVFSPVCLLGQSHFTRSLSLQDLNPKTALHPASGGFIHANTTTNGGINYPAFVRLDSLGQPLQTVVLNNDLSADGFVRDLERLAGGGYAAAFRREGPIPTISSFIYVLDSMGVPLACQEVAPSAFVEEIEPTPDGGFLAVGACINGFSWNALAVRFNALGDTLWSRTFEFPTDYMLFLDATILPNGDFVMATQIGLSGGLTRLSSSGQLMWAIQYPAISGSNVIPEKIMYSTDGNLYTGGYTYGTIYNAVAQSFDTLGNFLWSKEIAYITNATFRKVAITPNGNVLFAGSGRVNNMPQPGDSGFNLCFSPSGNVRWMHSYNFPNNDFFSDVERLPDGGEFWTGGSFTHTVFLRTSAAYSSIGSCTLIPIDTTTTNNLFDAIGVQTNLLLRIFPTPLPFTTSTDSLTSTLLCTGVNVEDARTEKAAMVVPQPMHHTARILLSEGSLADDAQLHIIDLSGRSLALPLTRLPDGWEIQRGDLPAGIYAYQVLQGGQRIASGKLWIAD